MKVTYCSSSSGFWPAYSSQHCSRACFLINKKLRVSFWTVKHSRSDLSSLTLELRETMIHIHNVYSPPPGSLQDINREFLIYSLWDLLNKPGEHLLVRDFNVHHPMWGEARCTQ